MGKARRAVGQTMRQTMRTGWGAALVAASALAAAGCGDDGDGSDLVLEKPAVIPAKIADDLAKKSDEVSTLLEAGDTCGAAEKADDLVSEVEKADDQIPSALQEELEQGAVQLQNTVNCTPEPEKPKKDKDKGEDEEDGDGGDHEDELLGEGDGDSAPGNSENAPGHNKGDGD